jgi:hypothetical protein
VHPDSKAIQHASSDYEVGELKIELAVSQNASPLQVTTTTFRVLVESTEVTIGEKKISKIVSSILVYTKDGTELTAVSTEWQSCTRDDSPMHVGLTSAALKEEET